MEKISNDLRYSSYGLTFMKNKYIYMKRSFEEYDDHFIYLIDSILNEKLPVIYKCKRLYILESPKAKSKPSVIYDNLSELTLTNNDVLYELTFDEYLKIFKEFISCSGTTNKPNI